MFVKNNTLWLYLFDWVFVNKKDRFLIFKLSCFWRFLLKIWTFLYRCERIVFLFKVFLLRGFLREIVIYPCVYWFQFSFSGPCLLMEDFTKLQESDLITVGFFRGCVKSWLGTADHQDPLLYKKLGYSVYEKDESRFLGKDGRQLSSYGFSKNL